MEKDQMYVVHLYLARCHMPTRTRPHSLPLTLALTLPYFITPSLPCSPTRPRSARSLPTSPLSTSLSIFSHSRALLATHSVALLVGDPPITTPSLPASLAITTNPIYTSLCPSTRSCSLQCVSVASSGATERIHKVAVQMMENARSAWKVCIALGCLCCVTFHTD